MTRVTDLSRAYNHSKRSIKPFSLIYVSCTTKNAAQPLAPHTTALLSSFSHLDAETRPRSESLDLELDREVSGRAPAEAVILALHHHGAGRLAVVEVEADGVDQDHRAHLLVYHHRAQVQAIRLRSIIDDEGGRGPGGSWRDGGLLLHPNPPHFSLKCCFFLLSLSVNAFLDSLLVLRTICLSFQ